VRRTHAAAFGATTTYLTNRFAWFGTSKPFETLTQTFRRTDLGDFNAHHYRYARDMSTFLVEVTEATFTRAGFDRMSETESAALCAQGSRPISTAIRCSRTIRCGGVSRSCATRAGGTLAMC
jgi:hypothetical protein